jgi:formamidopyrimidine-DNA glycosylase
MPELPEVETLCRQLRHVVLGARILKGLILDERLGKMADPGGKKILSILRRGKTIQFQLEGDISLFFQLRMTGRFHWQEGGDVPPRARLHLSFPHGNLFLTDVRRLATLQCDCGENGFAQGWEPLEDLDHRRLFEIAGRRRLPVKNLLMDQRVVAGIGNIYASEILFRAGISPLRPASDLSLRDWKKVVRAVREALGRAVRCRGTSISDWKDLFGEKGEYQRHLLVYGRAGKACRRCGATVRRVALSGRGTFYCPGCQAG